MGARTFSSSVGYHFIRLQGISILDIFEQTSNGYLLTAQNNLNQRFYWQSYTWAWLHHSPPIQFSVSGRNLEFQSSGYEGSFLARTGVWLRLGHLRMPFNKCNFEYDCLLWFSSDVYTFCQNWKRSNFALNSNAQKVFQSIQKCSRIGLINIRALQH